MISPVVFDTSFKTIHVLVALCDNKYQGIVPVPQRIGNGQDPDQNLYWGAGYGIRTFFKKSNHWKLLSRFKIDSLKTERLVFQHTGNKYILVADAYNGKYIETCTVDFLKSCAGQLKDTIRVNGITIGINGNAQLLSYIGHNGLMDFSLENTFINTDGKKRDAIILACISQRYFRNYLAAANTTPVLWSTGLMSPEAYTLHDALESYINKSSAEETRNSAAKAYARYQRCSLKAAKSLLVSGF